MRNIVRSLIFSIALLVLAQAACYPDDADIPKCPTSTTCPKNSSPICGYFRNGTSKTYTNLCIGCQSKIFLYTKGACKSDKCVPNPRQICYLLYDPYCGTNPQGQRTTYGNQCFANAACATNLTKGECDKTASS